MRWLTASALLFAAQPLGAQNISFANFHTPAQMDAEMNRLQTRFPAIVSVSTIGSSLEGNPIRAIKISDNVATDETSEGDVIFMALHHAREWISAETALYIAEQLCLRYSTDPDLKSDMDNLEIWIIPVVNPDGYAYSDSTDRDWRKNRRNNGDGTFGVDLNRNWGYEWGLNSGSSPNTWEITYRGPAPFSEPETQVLRNFVQSRHNLKALVTYHSFSELFLRPWSYTTGDPPGEATLKAIADRSIDQIAAVHGRTYAPSIWYTSSGETTDFLWGETRTASFTPELRPAFGSVSGFAPPPSTILPNNEENFPVAAALVHDAGDREVWIRDHAADNGTEPSATWTGTGWSHAFWESPDIWTTPAALVEGTTVTLNIRISNSTGRLLRNVTVEGYYNDPQISLEFPGQGSMFIGTKTVNVPAGGTTVTMPWTVPMGANSWGDRHWCVGAVVRARSDMPLTNQAHRSSNIGMRNFQTTEMAAGQMMLVAATNFLDVAAELRTVVDSSQLPRGWRVVLPRVERDTLRPPRGIERKARLLGATGRLLEPGERALIPVRIIPPEGAPPGATADIRVHGALIPLVAGERPVLGNGYTFRAVVGPRRR